MEKESVSVAVEKKPLVNIEGRRLGALIVDFAILFGVTALIDLAFPGASKNYDALIFYGYFVLTTYFFNATPAQKVFGIEIVNEDGTRDLNIGLLLVREICAIISGVIVLILIISLLKLKDNRFWWDKIAKVKVVQKTKPIIAAKS